MPLKSRQLDLCSSSYFYWSARSPTVSFLSLLSLKLELSSLCSLAQSQGLSHSHLWLSTQGPSRSLCYQSSLSCRSSPFRTQSRSDAFPELVVTGGRSNCSVDIGMEEAGGGVVERPHKKHLGAIEVNNGIRAYDVEREGAVELDPWVNLIGGDTHVRQEQCRTDVDALGLRVYGLDRVGVVLSGNGMVALPHRGHGVAGVTLLLHNQHQLLVLLLRFREKLSPKSENLAVASADNIHAKPKSKPIDRQVKVFFAVPETVVAKIELPDGVVLQGVGVSSRTSTQHCS
ncbi:UBX domain-containing protein [Arachis hypogaea]|nr:UBX domain-containing protein [Arachis hypogaea]